MIRILRVIPDLEVGGVQRQMLLSFRGLAARGHECEVCCIAKEGQNAAKFRAEGFRVHVIPFRSRLDPAGLWKLRRLARGFDVVHGHMYAANMALNYALTGATAPRIINGYHNEILVSGVKQARRVARTAGKPAQFLAVGEAVRDALVKINVPREKITIVRNGVIGPDSPPPMPETRDGEPLRLVWMGRFVKQKRTDFLLDVAARCKDRGVPAHFTLVGDGPRFQKAQRKVREEGLEDIVSLPGVSSDVFAHLAEAEVYVSASFREGFPNALLEACAARRPFLVSDIAPHREVQGDSDAGLIRGMDADAWADAIAELAADRARVRRMAEEALAIGQRCSMERAVEEMEALYERVLALR